MNRESKRIIIDEIKKLSIDLSKNNNTIKKREFVDYINTCYPFLKLKESIVINELILEAYNEFSYSPVLQSSIIDNFLNDDGISKIFDPNRIFFLPKSLSLDSNEKIFSEIENLFIKMESVFGEIEKEDFFSSFQKFEKEMGNIKVIDVISLTGASKVEEKAREARKVFYNYKALIDRYEAIKLELSFLFIDFEQIRNVLKYLREDLVNMVVEVFGDNFKITNPDLFSFSTIKWMNLDVFLDKLDVEFKSIQEKTKVYFEIHKETYNRLGNSSLDRLNNMNGERGALKSAAIDIGVNAALSILKTREESKNTIAKLNYDIEVMKNFFSSDIKEIKLDVMRLLEIFKKVKEHLTPTLQHFTTSFKTIFENKIKKDFSLIFSISGIRELKNLNLNLLNEIKYLDVEIYNVRNVIENATDRVDNYKWNVENLRADNDFFIENEPIKPNLFLRIVSFDVANKIFKKMHNQWNVKTYDTRLSFYEYTELLNKEIKRLEFYELQFENFQKEQLKLKSMVKANSQQISNKLRDEEDIKNVISKNIVNIVSLSKLAKEVLESRLEERLISN